MSAVTDEQPATVEDRMKAAGISPDRIARHLAAGTIQCDGVVVTDLDQPAPKPARIVIAGNSLVADGVCKPGNLTASGAAAGAANAISRRPDLVAALSGDED